MAGRRLAMGALKTAPGGAGTRPPGGNRNGSDEPGRALRARGRAAARAAWEIPLPIHQEEVSEILAEVLSRDVETMLEVCENVDHRVQAGARPAGGLSP